MSECETACVASACTLDCVCACVCECECMSSVWCLGCEACDCPDAQASCQNMAAADWLVARVEELREGI